MELKEFVTKTLQQVLEGVKGAQDTISKGSGFVNLDPNKIKNCVAYTAGGAETQYVDFDVAVTTTEGSELSGGISVMGIGAKGTTSGENSSVSRIKFRVPIGLPVG